MNKIYIKIFTLVLLLSFMASPAFAVNPEKAYLQVAHLAPFADPATVDIELYGPFEIAVTAQEDIKLNGPPITKLEDVDYGDSYEYLRLDRGYYYIEVTPDGATKPAIQAFVELLGGTRYTALAVGDGVNQALDLLLLEDELAPIVGGEFNLRLGHLAPFASGEATADIRHQDGTPILENVDFGDVTEFIALEAGEYDLIITTPGGETTLIDPLPVTFDPGDIVSVFATGEGVNQSLGVFALPYDEIGDFLPLATYLQVAHLAPFAEDASVTITLNDAPELTGFDYGESTEYLVLPEGTYDVAVFPTGATEPAIEVEDVMLETNTYYTAIAIGDGVNQDLSLKLLVDDITAPAAGNFKLRLGHLAPFAEDPNTTADVRTDDGTVILNDVDFGDVAPYIELPEGTYDLKITTPSGFTTLINLAPVAFTDGQILSAFAVGNGTIKDLGGFALPSDAEGFFLPLEPIEYVTYLPLILNPVPPARLQVAHLAPFADPGTVDIKLNGETALPGVEYGDSTPYIELPQGSYLVEIFPEGSDTAAITETVDLTGGMDYTAIAVGDIVNQPPALLVLEDDNTAPAAGSFKLRLGHLAPFADELADTTADVRLDDGTVILPNVKFGDVADYLELEAGTYDLKITTPGGDTTLINLAPVTFTGGQILSAFAVGNGTIQDLGGFALPSDDVGFFLPLEARLQVAHLAPFADPGTVDIKLNGVTALPGVEYGDSTAYIELPEGSYDIEIFPDGSSTAAISALGVGLTGGMDYTAIAIGDGTNQDLSLKLLVDDNTSPAEGNFKLRLGHLAPFAEDPDTTADVRLDDGTVILNDVDFSAVAPYLELPEGTYDLKITTPDGVTTLIDLAPVTLTEGTILSAFAVGNGTIQDLGGFALPSGDVGFFLPLK